MLLWSYFELTLRPADPTLHAHNYRASQSLLPFSESRLQIGFSLIIFLLTSLNLTFSGHFSIKPAVVLLLFQTLASPYRYSFVLLFTLWDVTGLFWQLAICRRWTG